MWGMTGFCERVSGAALDYIFDLVEHKLGAVVFELWCCLRSEEYLRLRCYLLAFLLLLCLSR